MTDFWLSLARKGERWSDALVTLCAPRLTAQSLETCQEQHRPDWAEHSLFILSFDIDFEDDVLALPKLLEMLKEVGVKASFAVIGRWCERYPEEHKMIVDHGHDVINHTWSHPDNEELNPDAYFSKLTVEEKRTEILKGHQAIETHIGVSPRGFRTPHFGNEYTQDIYPILSSMDYLFSSSVTMARAPKASWPFQTPEHIWEIPVTTCPQHPVSSFDTWHGVRGPRAWHKKDKDFVNVLKGMLNKEKHFINLYFDPRDVVSGGLGQDCLQVVSESPTRVITYLDLVTSHL